jgi:hypothetical protein
MNTLFFSWGKRNLTILGKIMIIKALVIPIFTFVASACVVPDKYRKEIESKCFKFIWDGKPDKVKRNTKYTPNVLIGFSYHLMPSIFSLLCLSFPTQIPPVLFLFINNPEKDPKVSISLNAIYISSLDVQNKVVSSASWCIFW